MMFRLQKCFLKDLRSNTHCSNDPVSEILIIMKMNLLI